MRPGSWAGRTATKRAGEKTSAAGHGPWRRKRTKRWSRGKLPKPGRKEKFGYKADYQHLQQRHQFGKMANKLAGIRDERSGQQGNQWARRVFGLAGRFALNHFAGPPGDVRAREAHMDETLKRMPSSRSSSVATPALATRILPVTDGDDFLEMIS